MSINLDIGKYICLKLDILTDVVIYIAYICVCISVGTHTPRRIYVYNMYIVRETFISLYFSPQSN